MKNTYKPLVGVLILLCSQSPLFSQTPTAVDDGSQTFTPPFQIGLGVGYNYAPHPRHDYYISATNGTLQRDLFPKASFVGSVVVAYAIPFRYEQIYKDGAPVGKLHPVPGPVSILSSFNITEVNTSMDFNTSLSGGLGLGFNINNVMHLGVFCDITKARFLKDAYADSLGKQIMVASTPLTSLDRTDDRFFKDGIITSFSLKAVFVINRRQTDVSATTNAFNNLDEQIGFSPRIKETKAAKKARKATEKKAAQDEKAAKKAAGKAAK